jgi:AICAR transformylase/IMP cyclohydrolase PurH
MCQTGLADKESAVTQHHEEFADTVVVPGPNLRSRFVDTEQVEDEVAEQIDGGGARFCPTCHGAFPSPVLTGPDDATALDDLPPAG